MLKNFFVPHLEKFLSRFEVLADPLFRNVKITFGYTPLKIHNSQPLNLNFLHRVEGSLTRVTVSQIFDISCLADRIDKRVTGTANGQNCIVFGGLEYK